MKFSIIIFAVFLSAISIGCKKSDDLISIQGRVTNFQGTPLKDATVHITAKNVDLTFQTKDNGEFSFTGVISKDVYSVLVYRSSYLPFSKNISNTGGTTVTFPDIVLEETPLFLTVDKNKLVFPPAGEIQGVLVSTIEPWEVVDTMDWITYKATPGTPGSIFFDCKPNLGNYARKGTIYVKGSGLEVPIQVFQYPIFKIISRSDQGKLQSPCDTVAIKFNRKLKYAYAIPNTPTLSINLTYEEDSSLVKFVLNRYFGESLQVEITGVDSLTNTMVSESMLFNFYAKKLMLPSDLVSSYVFSPDESHVYAYAQQSGKLYKINAQNNTIEAEVSVSKPMGEIVFNEYNDKIYALAAYANEIQVLNSDNLALSSTIVFSPDQFDNNVYPAVYPKRLVFAKNGMGIVSLYWNSGNVSRFKTINSADNNKVENYGTGFTPGFLTSPNFDGSKLIIVVSDNANHKVETYDPVTGLKSIHDISSILSSVEYMVSSKTLNKIFIGTNHVNTIIDMNDYSTVGLNYYTGAQYNHGLLFSENPGNPDEIYDLGDTQICVHDMAAEKTTYLCNTYTYFQTQFRMTKDKNYIQFNRGSELIFVAKQMLK